METKESITHESSDFDRGYEKGYHCKDYTWEDGIKCISNLLHPESKYYQEGYNKGQRDRMRDEIQKWLF